jgi:uncharacterized protein YndB with AHSA1/START domain
MANSIKVAVTVNAPVEKVWDIFINPDYLKHWLPGFVSIDHLDGEIGKQGSTHKMKFLERGKVSEVIEEVLFVDPMKQYSFDMRNESFSTLADVHFISIGQVTEIIQAVQFSPKGIFMKLLMPLVKGEMRKRMTNDLKKLKEFIESRK